MRRGFTLIELLIVVAIIAILAAIAVPNFLEAQVRSKVSRAKADMRTLATALESYTVDNNCPPSDCGNGAETLRRPYFHRDKHDEPKANFTIGFELTTPISYLASIAPLKDVFKLDTPRTGNVSGREYYGFASWRYREKFLATAKYAPLVARNGHWVIMGAGPDRYTNNGPNHKVDLGNVNTIPRGVNYDPTNGTISNGDIYRTQKFSDGGWENPTRPISGD